MFWWLESGVVVRQKEEEVGLVERVEEGSRMRCCWREAIRGPRMKVLLALGLVFGTAASERQDKREVTDSTALILSYAFLNLPRSSIPLCTAG